MDLGPMQPRKDFAEICCKRRKDFGAITAHAHQTHGRLLVCAHLGSMNDTDCIDLCVPPGQPKRR
jgi:hypothetical protein